MNKIRLHIGLFIFCLGLCQVLFGQYSIVKISDAYDGNCDGSLELVSADASNPITDILWSNGSTSNSISTLCPGTYQVDFTTSDGCGWSLSKEIEGYGCYIHLEEFGAIITPSCFTSSEDRKAGIGNGRIQITSDEQFGPYGYRWILEDVEELGVTYDTIYGTSVFNLAAKTYSVLITNYDYPACHSTLNFIVPDSITTCLITGGEDLIITCSNIVGYSQIQNWIDNHANIYVDDCSQISWEYIISDTIPTECPEEETMIPVQFTATNACGVSSTLIRKIIIKNECYQLQATSDLNYFLDVSDSEICDCEYEYRFEVLYYQDVIDITKTAEYHLDHSNLPLSTIATKEGLNNGECVNFDYDRFDLPNVDGTYFQVAYCGSCRLEANYYVEDMNCSFGSISISDGSSGPSPHLGVYGNTWSCLNSTPHTTEWRKNGSYVGSGDNLPLISPYDGTYSVTVTCGGGDCFQTASRTIGGGQCSAVSVEITDEGQYIQATAFGCTAPAFYKFFRYEQGEVIVVSPRSQINTYNYYIDGRYRVCMDCNNCNACDEIDICSRTIIDPSSQLYDGSIISLEGHVAGCSSSDQLTYAYFLNGAPLSAVPTSQSSYTPVVNGDYRVDVTCEGICTKASEVIEVRDICTYSAPLQVSNPALSGTGAGLGCYETPEIHWYMGPTQSGPWSPVSGASDLTYTPTANGFYYYDIRCDACDIIDSEVVEVTWICGLPGDVTISYNTLDQELIASVTGDCSNPEEAEYIWFSSANMEKARGIGMNTYNPLVNGAYYVTVVCDGCTGIPSNIIEITDICDTVSVSIQDLGGGSFSVQEVTGCYGSVDYAWKMAVLGVTTDGDPVGTNQSSYTALETGTYWVEISCDECDEESNRIDYIVCESEFIIGYDLANNLLHVVEGSVQGCYDHSSIKYYWYRDGEPLNEQGELNGRWIPQGAGTYHAELKCGNCEPVPSNTQTVNCECFTYFNENNARICKNSGDLQLQSSGFCEEPLDGVWTFDGNIIDPPYIVSTDLPAGSYNITYTGEDANGCDFTSAGNIIILEPYFDVDFSCFFDFEDDGVLTVRFLWAYEQNQQSGNPSRNIHFEIYNVTKNNILIFVRDHWSGVNLHLGPDKMECGDILRIIGTAEYSFTDTRGTTCSSGEVIIDEITTCDPCQLLFSGINTSSDEFSSKFYSIYPNPARDEFFIQYPSDIKNNITIELYNMLGAKIVVRNEEIGKGDNQIKFLTKNIPTGVYFGVIKDAETQHNFKIEIIKE